jgi:uncharacterized protein
VPKRQRYLLTLLLLILTISGLSRLSFDVAFLRLLPTQLGQVKGLSLLLKHFGLPQEIVLTLESADPDLSAELTTSLAQTLRQHPHLIQRVVDAPPWETQPDQLAELLAYAAINAPPPRFAKLRARLDPAHATTHAAAALEKINATLSIGEATLLSYDPFGILPLAFGNEAAGLTDLSEFSSASGQFRLLYAEATPPLTSYRTAGAWLDQVKSVVAQWQAQQPDPSLFTIGMTGEPLFLAEISASMERDMMLSGITTLALVALIFWLFYRQLRPLFLLLGTIALAFILSLAASGLILGQITVLSVGFASILIGLSVDYGLILYQRRLLTEGSVSDLRRHTTSTIGWAALTTASAFLALNASHFPGLAQLGTLVALGIGIAAALMLGPFAAAIAKLPALPRPPIPPTPTINRYPKLAWGVTSLFSLVSLPLLVKGLPTLDTTTHALHPQHSLAYQTSARIEQVLLGQNQRIPFIVHADAPEQMPERLAKARQWLEHQQQAGHLSSFWLPDALWPSAPHQQTNLLALGDLPSQAPALQTALDETGFTAEAFALTGAVLAQWQQFAQTPTPLFPQQALSLWTLRRSIDRSTSAPAISGIMVPAPELTEHAQSQLFTSPAPGLYPAHWARLGTELATLSHHDFSRIALAFFAILLVMLAAAYRNLLDVGLTVLTVALALLGLTGIMTLLGIQWNFFSLASLLLILGTGVDYSLHILLGLRQTQGDWPLVMRTIGKPLALCALSTIAGFGSLAFASNLGLASLGIVCALGIGSNLLLTLFLLPQVWLRLVHR